MSENPHCPECGREIPAGSPEGLCPICLLKAGFESQPETCASVPREPSTAHPAAPDNPFLHPTLNSPVYSGDFVPPTPEQLAAHFPQLEILQLLGKGGMGAVYKARQRGLDRLIAVKILPEEIGHDAAFAERFQREARAMAKLDHPHIVGVHDFGKTDGLFYFFMEFVDGVNLRQAIQAGTMSPQDALAVVPQICDALQFAHDEGIVHRDIKPENILIDKRGQVKIADFGLAKLLGTEPADHALTGTHQVMGTLRYMAPEQLDGARDVDHRADIYSLGVVFYELLTGELPIGRFAPPSKKVQIDVRLDEVVLRALENERELRYQRADELGTSVESITAVDGQSTRLAPTAFGARLSRTALAGAILAPFVLVSAPLVILILMGHIAAMTWFTCVAGVLSVAVTFATTILGCVAIGQIRHSKGTLYGLRLAVADAFLYPLILFDCLIAVMVSVPLFAIDSAIYLNGQEGPKLLWKIAIAPIGSVGVPLLIGWIDYLIVRAVWRTVTGHQMCMLAVASVVRGDSSPPKSCVNESTRQRNSQRWWVIGASAALYWLSLVLPAGYLRVNQPGTSIQGTLMSGAEMYLAALKFGFTIWLANPALWVGWILLAFHRPWLALLVGTLGFGLALGASLNSDSAFVLQSGYACWVASAGVFAIGTIAVIVRDRWNGQKALKSIDRNQADQRNVPHKDVNEAFLKEIPSPSP